MTWTVDRVNTLREMWVRPECSAATIAAHLGGITRMAVIGKAHRLGLMAVARTELSMTPAAIYGREYRSGIRRRFVNKPKPVQRRRFHAVRSPAPVVELPAPAPTVAACEPVQFEHTRNRHCRWPLWNADDAEKLCCGAPADVARGRSYCGAHHRRATVR